MSDLMTGNNGTRRHQRTRTEKCWSDNGVGLHSWRAFIMAVGRMSGTGNVARITSHKTENEFPWLRVRRFFVVVVCLFLIFI